jgi:V/A-type H+-transporting ATPase subunit A
MVVDICRAEFEFENFNQVAEYFKKLINVCRQMNYSEFKSDKFNDYRRQLEELINN